MNKDNMVLDAAESILFRNALTSMLPTLYGQKLRNILYPRFIPVAADAPSGATEIKWREYESYGQAKFIFDYSKDFPAADAGGREHLVPIFDIGTSYRYTIKEVRRTALAGIPLTTIKANAARRAIEEKLESIACFGDSARSLNGFFNYPGVNVATLAGAAVGGSKLWSAKTPLEILKDLNQMITTVDAVTFGREIIDTIIIPLAQMQLLKTTPFSSYSDKTIYTFFTENNPGIMLEAWPALKGAGISGADLMIGYVRDIEHVRFEIPVAFEQHPEQLDGMEYKIPCHAETGGVIMPYPLACVRASGL